MSPDESQLRAALREGEGEGVDPDAVLARAGRRRDERRRRMRVMTGSAAAAAVVVGCAALVVALSSGDDGTRGSAGQAPSAVPAMPTATVVHGGPVLGASSAAPAYDAPSCPAAPEQFALPGGGGIGRFGSAGELLPSDVIALIVCAYDGSHGGAYSSSLVVATRVTGAAATSVVAELNSAPALGRPRVCPDNTTPEDTGKSFRIVGVTPSETTTKPVVITVACAHITATNGTALRYLAGVPEALLRLLP